MTNDLLFTLDLLDRLPHLPLLADLSHFLVGREFPYPVTDDNHALMRRIIDNSWAFHGAWHRASRCRSRSPSRTTKSGSISSWIGGAMVSPAGGRRAAADASLAFTCELGPKPYAITGRDGNDTTDRWAEAVQMKRMVQELWAAGAA